MNMRWRSIEISPAPTPISELARSLIGRAEETETHIIEALRLSPRDTMAYLWMNYAGIAKIHLGALGPSGRLVSTGDRGQPKLSGMPIYVGGRARAAWST